MEECWLSVEEIAAYPGFNPDTIYKQIERKKLPAHNLGDCASSWRRRLMRG